MAASQIEIVTRNLIDIERYTNDIRTQLLATIRQSWSDSEDTDVEKAVHAVAALFDRATTKALFNHLTQEPPADALYRDKLHGPGAQAALSGSNRPGPKPGSAAARNRAKKAAETRAKNKAATATRDSLPTGIPGTSSTDFPGGD